MADLAAGDVTDTLNSTGWAPQLGKVVNVKLTFGNGSLTYPSGGVPLTKAKMGCPNALQAFVMNETSAAVTTLWKYDASAETLRAYTASGTSAEFVATSTAIAAQEIHATAIGF